jgi:predicted translin family RNA/ssDNA-binding protein
LTATTYLLGIADFTGELMRRAINAVADGDRTKALEICAFLRPLVQGKLLKYRKCEMIDHHNCRL